MAALRGRFVGRAAEERAAIAETCGERLDHDALRRRAHSIAGTAGLFGFDRIGDEAKALEDAIDNDLPDEEVRARATTLEASLAALSGPEPPGPAER